MCARGIPWLAMSLAALLGACSMTFGADPPPWPLEGAAIDVRGLQQVTSPYYYDFPAVVRGVDDAWWFAHPNEGLTSVQLVRLSDPPLEESLAIGTVKIAAAPGEFYPRVQLAGRSAVYALLSDGRLLIHRPGSAEDRAYHIGEDAKSAADRFVGHSPNDASVAWLTKSSLELARVDGSHKLSLWLRPGEEQFLRLEWSDDGDVVMVAFTTQNGPIWQYVDLDSGEQWLDGTPLNDPPPGMPLDTFRYLAESRTVIRCDGSGLRAIPLDRDHLQPDRVLDARHCSFPYAWDANTDAHPCCYSTPCLCTRPLDSVAGDRIWYFAREGGKNFLRTVESQGSEPQVLLEVPPIPMDIRGSHLAQVDATWDALPPWIHAVPARLDGRPVMERGRALRISRDGARVRYLEHTANLEGAGDLMSGPVDGPAERVAFNAVRFDELDDGRLIAVTNRPFIGDHNRVVIIDEARRTLRRLVEGAMDYILIPGEAAVLVSMSPPSDHDLLTFVRVALPAR